jgi:hypothetical protein
MGTNKDSNGDKAETYVNMCHIGDQVDTNKDNDSGAREAKTPQEEVHSHFKLEEREQKLEEKE